MTFALIAVARAAPEVCNGADDDGDGAIDEAPIVWFADADGDGAGDRATLLVTADCTAPAAATSDGGDCDDGDDEVGPEAVEVPNAIDDDCNGLVDDRNLPAGCVALPDADSTFLFCDRRRTWNAALGECETSGYRLLTLDGPTENAFVVPSLGASDYWWIGLREQGGDFQWEDGTASWGDNWARGEPNAPGNHDCALIDRGDGEWYNWSCETPYPFVCEADCVPVRTYADDDGDGFGDPGSGSDGCDPSASRVYNDRDCDDGDAGDTVHLWYDDGDGDGFGGSVATVSCAAPPGAVADGTDCDDADDRVNVGGTEVCGGADEDCDGLVDDADPSVDPSSGVRWFVDADGDGFGADPAIEGCVAPEIHAADGGDCDDGDPGVFPGAEEIDADGIDQDCDGSGDPSGDGGTRTPTAGDAPIDTGCGCAGAPGPGWLGLLGLFGLLVPRRRT